jgi:hypothetical protein
MDRLVASEFTALVNIVEDPHASKEYTRRCHDRPDAEHTADQRLDWRALGLISRFYTSRNVS